MEDFNNKDWNKRIEDIKNNLCLGNTNAGPLLSIMMSPYAQKDFCHSDIDVSDVLTIIADQIKQLRKTIRNGGIVPISLLESTFKDVLQDHMAYACLDKDLKFCVRHYGEEDWKDILYVFPYMNCTTAFDISFKYEQIHQP